MKIRIITLSWSVAVEVRGVYLQIGIRGWCGKKYWPFGHLVGRGDVRTLNTWFVGPFYFAAVR